MTTAAGVRLAKLSLFAELVEGAWLREARGAHLFVFGVSAAPLNVVMVPGADPPAGVVEELLDAAAATGLPYSLNVRRGALTALAERRGMVADEEISVMWLGDARLQAADVPGLSIRELAPEEAPLGVALQTAAFEAPEDLFAPLTTPRLLATPGIRLFAGEVAGEPVTTAMGIRLGDAVAILNVATLPSHRRRGYGTAITARAVAEGLSDGGSSAWLESSPSALGVYERLGFRTVETRACWTTQNTLALSQSAAK